MEHQKYTREDVYNMFGILTKKQVEYEEWHKQSEKELKAWKIETTKKYEERKKEFVKENEESQRKWQKKSDRVTLALKETMKETNRHLGGIGKSLDHVTEDYFYSSISTTLNVNGIQYDNVEKKFACKTKITDLKFQKKKPVFFIHRLL